VPRRVAIISKMDAEGKAFSHLVWSAYSKAEAEKLFGMFPEEYAELQSDGILGGDEEWKQELASIDDYVNNPVGFFQAQRTSMYYYYRDKFGRPFLEAALDEPEMAMPRIVKFFEGRVDDWVNAKGEFAGFDENLTISRRFEVSENIDFSAVRQKVAVRAAQDLLQSFRIVKGLEASIELHIRKRRDDKLRHETIAGVIAIDEASQVEPDPEFARAVYLAKDASRESGRAPDPRIHVRPRLIAEKEPGGNELKEKIDFHVSVVADPVTHPPLTYDGESAVYDIRVDWKLAAKGGGKREVTAIVSVFDKNKVIVGKPAELVLGAVANPEAAPDVGELKLAFRPKTTNSAGKPIAPPALGGSNGTTVDRGGTLYEKYVSQKAIPSGERWGELEVASVRPQVWLRWKDAPAKTSYFYYELKVSGGAHRYEKEYGGGTGMSDRFPDELQGSPANHCFVFHLDWPVGHVGNLRVQGTLKAFEKPMPGDTWKRQTPAAKIDFDFPLEIPDQRKGSQVELVAMLTKRIPVGELAGVDLPPADKERLAKFLQNGMVSVERAEPFDSSKADIWKRKWGTEEIGSTAKVASVGARLHIRWHDAPPDLTYYYDFEVTGGAPEVQVKESDSILPRDDFPPKATSFAPGGTAFALKLPWPMSGGPLSVKGTLYALPKKDYRGETWREAKPVATYPFQASYQLRNLSRYGEAQYVTQGFAQLQVMVLMAYVQRGRRVAKITSCGKTVYGLIDPEYYSGGYFPKKPSYSHWLVRNLPYGAQVGGSAKVEFKDFGEDVSLEIPLAPLNGKQDPLAGPTPMFLDYTQKALEKLEKLKAGNPIGATLDTIGREYQGLSNNWRQWDYSKAAEYIRLEEEYYEKYYKGQLVGEKRPIYIAAAQRALASQHGGRYFLAVEWGNKAADGFLSEAVSKIQASGAPAGEIASVLSGLYSSHAENLLKMTGDVAAAEAAWRQSIEYAGIREGDPSKVVSPYQVEKSFR